MKKILSIIIFICIFMFIPSVYASDNLDVKKRVYDYADTFTDLEEKHFESLINDYINEYKMDLVILTKKNYNGDMNEYAKEFYSNNLFGKNSTNDGIILFLNIKNNIIEYTIVCNGEAILMYDDNRLNELNNSLNYYINAPKSMVNLFISRISSYAKRGIPEGSLNKYINENGKVKKYKKDYSFIAYTVIFLISFLFTYLIICILRSKNNTVIEAKEASTYLDAESFKLLKDDVYLSKSDKSFI